MGFFQSLYELAVPGAKQRRLAKEALVAYKAQKRSENHGEFSLPDYKPICGKAPIGTHVVPLTWGFFPCECWTTKVSSNGHVVCVSMNGGKAGTDADAQYQAVRPSFFPNEPAVMRITDQRTEDGQNIYIFGHFPQVIPDEAIRTQLAIDKQDGSLKPTDNSYTLGRAHTKYSEYMSPDGRRWIFLDADPFGHRPPTSRNINRWDSSFPVDVITTGEIYPVDVLPVEWTKNEATGEFIACKCLFSGLKFDKNAIYEGDFEQTTLYRHLNDVFAKELQQVQNEVRTQEKTAISAKHPAPRTLSASTLTQGGKMDMQMKKMQDIGQHRTLTPVKKSRTGRGHKSKRTASR